MTYTELQVTSNFSFLRGASHPDELFRQAHGYGYKTLAMTDRNSLAGVVRGHTVARDNGMRLIVGCRLDLQDGPSLLAYPTDRDSYARLSRLLTTGKLRAPKGKCHIKREDVYGHTKGIKFIALEADENQLKEYREVFGRNLYLAATHYYQGDDARRLALLSRLSAKLNIPLVATNDVHYHAPERQALQDVLTCIREKCTIDTAGFRLHANAERHLKTPQEMTRLFKDYPDAIRRTQEIAAACRFSLDELRYEYPHEITSENRTPQEELTRLTWQGAAERFPAGIPANIRETIEKELDFIAKVNYAPYFLTVHDIVRFARNPGKGKEPILCQGRGSAANSVVCYCLGITSVDPTEINLLFERFISSARNEPPDIDVDFEHERREEVMQYIYEKYGRDRAGIVATVVEYRRKGAIRDVGKAMGLSVDTVNRLSGALSHFDEWLDGDNLREQGLDPADRRLRQTIRLAWALMGFPRHLSQHTGGFVITRGALADLCPIMNAAMKDRTCIEWNKDDIDALGMLKVDVLALGMLSCVRKCFDLMKKHHGQNLTLATIPQNDGPTYDMICKADTIGVFQIESRAQMSMLPRLRPRCFYDLVIEVSIVRPGPIQGNMVHPYLRRRQGLEPVKYPKPELEAILDKTKGVPLFQEQAMSIAIVAAGFSPTDADRLRRSMATFRNPGLIKDFETKLIQGMIRNGYELEFAHQLCRQIKGFGSYGFPESHAASFALLVYASSWIKCHYPDVFACALLNSQPMGFYAPAQLISDARNHGVEVRAVDINYSHWDSILEEKQERWCPVRLGFREIKGLPETEMGQLAELRGAGYPDIATLRQRAGLSLSTLETLARADAFRSIGLDRRKALWEVTALADKPSSLFENQPMEAIAEPAVDLPAMRLSEHVVHDYATSSFSLKAHPVSFLRPKFDRLKAIPAKRIWDLRSGASVKLAGLILVRQRPSTANNVVFVTVEDETGVANLVLFKNVFEKFRKDLLSAKLLMVEGKLEREGDVIHIIARQLCDLSPWLRDLSRPDTESLPLLARTAGSESDIARSAIPEARNFK